MILILYLVLFLFFELVTYLRFNTFLKINTIYNIVWCFGSIATEINYAGLYSISLTSHSYIVVSLILFNIIYILRGRNSNADSEVIKKFKSDLRHSNLKPLYYANYLSYIFMLPILFNALKIIVTQGFAALRTYAYVESELLANLMQIRITAWIIYPIFVVTVMFAVIFIITDTKNKILPFMAIVDIAIYIFSFGGRGFIVISLMYFIFALFMWFSLRKRKIYIKLKYRIYGVLIGGGLYYLISLRMLRGLNVLENTIIYLFGGITYFDIIVREVKYESYIYGRGMLGIIVSPILYLFSIVFDSPNLTSEYIIKQATDTFYFVSDSYRFNALPTMLYVFVLDGGMWGVIAGTILLSIIVTYVERSYYNKPNLIVYMLYIYSAYAVFNSVVVYDFYTIKSFFILGFIIIFGKMTKPKIGKL